jgi:hypothetical protein
MKRFKYGPLRFTHIPEIQVASPRMKIKLAIMLRGLANGSIPTVE